MTIAFGTRPQSLGPFGSPDTSLPLSFQPIQAGKSHFGYIYGVALLGSLSIYLLLNAMSEDGIDAYRVMSVLGYCLLPLNGLAALGVFAKGFGFAG